MDNKYTDYAKDHMKNAMEYGQNILVTAKTTGSEVANKITATVAENIELGKSYMNCKSFEDVVSWGEKMVHTNLDHCVNAASEIYNKACTEVTKINSDIAKKAAQCMSKHKDKVDHN